MVCVYAPHDTVIDRSRQCLLPDDAITGSCADEPAWPDLACSVGLAETEQTMRIIDAAFAGERGAVTRQIGSETDRIAVHKTQRRCLVEANFGQLLQ